MVAYFPIQNEISHYFINMNTWVIYIRIYSYILYQQHWTTQLLAWIWVDTLYISWGDDITPLVFIVATIILECVNWGAANAGAASAKLFQVRKGYISTVTFQASKVSKRDTGYTIYRYTFGHWMDWEVPYSQNLSGFCLGIMAMFDRHFPCKCEGPTRPRKN